MEKHTVFMDWKNQYCENDYTTQRNLQIQCNPYQATTVFIPWRVTSVRQYHLPSGHEEIGATIAELAKVGIVPPVPSPFNSQCGLFGNLMAHGE